MPLQNSSVCVVLCLFGAAAGWSQEGTAPDRAATERVLATIDGQEYTLQDVRRLRTFIPPNLMPQASQLTNRQLLSLMHNLVGTASAAEKENLLEKEPYKSQWHFTRLNFLANVYANELGRTITVSDEELRDYYEQNKARYESVRVSAIYINYTPQVGGAPAADGKQRLSEEQAKQKTGKLHAELKNGADFAALAIEHSDDKTSAEKGGDLGVFNLESSIPDTIKAAILGLKVDEISEIVKDGSRFYIFKATERQDKPLEEIKSKLEPTLRSRKLLMITQKAQMSVPIEFTDDPALNERPPAAPRPPKP